MHCINTAFPFLMTMESTNEAIPVVLGIVCLFFCCFVYKFRRDGSKLKLPPGPRPWPVIGNLHLLGNLPHYSLTTLAKKYGSIMFLRLGSVPTVVVSSPAMAKESLKTHDMVFATRPNCTYGKYVCYDHKDVAFGPYGAYWRDIRKLCTVELLAAKRIESFRLLREEEASAMVASMWKESEQGARCVDLMKFVSTFTRNNTCRMFANRTYSDNELNGGIGFNQMVHEIEQLLRAFCIGDLIPSLDWLDLYGFRRRMQAAHKIFDGFAEKVIEEHIQRRMEESKQNKGDRVKDFVDVMLDITETGGQTISRINIKAIILDMLGGGMETSSSLIEWAMNELLRNPATLARAQQEMDCQVGRKQLIKENDIVKLEYLQCVVKETLRLHPPAPLLLPRESMEGCSVGGYFIPPKARLYVNVWAIGRDESVWKDANLFKPERFMGCDVDVRGQDFDLLPFGTGRRGCPGITMGLSVSELGLAQLIHCFDWTVEDEVNMEETCSINDRVKTRLSARPSWRLTAEYPI